MSEPARARIDVFRPSIGDREAMAVRDVFASNWVGRGQLVRSFEKEFAAHINQSPENVLSVSSCTEGLFHVMEALAIGPGDDVVLPTIHFLGAANAVAARGARPIFCDVHPHTLNARLTDVAAALTERCRVVLLVHYGGLPGEVAAIADLCRRHGIFLVEDAALAIASSQRGRACGTFGDVGLWSFDAMKTLVTGEGGMIWCRDGDLAENLRLQTFLGLSEAGGIASPKGSRWWEFEVNTFGRRAIIDDIRAAIGLVQLERLPDFIRQRQRIDSWYREQLSDLQYLALPPPSPDEAKHSHSFFWIQVAPETRDTLATFLRRHDIYTTFRYAPLHQIAAYRHGGRELPDADEAAKRTLLLPQHQGLTREDVLRVTELLHRYFLDQLPQLR